MCDDAPCADRIFLAPLKRSREFRTLRPRLAGRAPHQPFDSWRDGDGFHFFVFALVSPIGAPGNGSTNGASAGEAEVPVAVFAMHPDALGPVSAVVVIPSADGRQAEVASILDGRTLYTMPFPPQPDVSMTVVSGGA